MAGRCNSRGCEWFFGDRFARCVAKRCRKRGLDKPSQRIVEFIESRGVRAATVLEIGGVMPRNPPTPGRTGRPGVSRKRQRWTRIV